MQVICLSDKKGNLLCKISTYDQKVFELLFKRLKKNKQLNVYEERR